MALLLWPPHFAKLSDICRLCQSPSQEMASILRLAPVHRSPMVNLNRTISKAQRLNTLGPKTQYAFLPMYSTVPNKHIATAIYLPIFFYQVRPYQSSYANQIFNNFKIATVFEADDIFFFENNPLFSALKRPSFVNYA